MLIAHVSCERDLEQAQNPLESVLLPRPCVTFWVTTLFHD